MKRHAVLCFYALALGLSWLGWAPMVAASYGIAPFTHPLFQVLLILPAVGPLLAAVIVTGAGQGRAGVKGLLAGLVR